MSDNPAIIARQLVEAIVPPERRAPGWEDTWERLIARCAEPVGYSALMAAAMIDGKLAIAQNTINFLPVEPAHTERPN